MNRNKGFALIEMLISLVIIMLLAYLYMKFAFKDAAGVSPETRKALAENGIKTNRADSMVQHAQETVDKFNKKAAADQHEYDANK
jgi:prepilin-type N-terminal cleavage/methylation domain-containing protein